ncbi:MAG TPA: helix-turn-helix domain-containing protein [Nocardioides sp.]|uniref:winged helix-turn-helix domain-containing protein n=1 Tax=Nocardioides sp. TaxID=35761 RepID=UPI002ED837B2
MARYDDPRILRAIAHPVRNRILSELYAVGSLRAADIARELDVPANQASFHLRQLAKYGLVEEAPEEARDRRDRVWRLADPSGISFRTKDVETQPGGKAAVGVFRRQARAWGHRLVESAYAEEPLPEDQNRTISDWSLRLTREEVDELSGELDRLVQSWRDRTQGDGGGRTTYSLFAVLQPYPEVPEDSGT